MRVGRKTSPLAAICEGYIPVTPEHPYPDPKVGQLAMELDTGGNMENQSLSDIIQESLAAVEPEAQEAPVNQEPGEVDDSEATVDDLIAGLVDEDEDESEANAEEVEDADEDPSLSETYQVKVDGEIVEVSLKEALAGYQRQADYTRKAQALAAEKQEFEEALTEVSDVIGSMEQLDAAWDENPVSVLAHFTANTENPTHAVALLIKELAAANLLEKDFLEMFGITSDIQRSWSKESEVENLKRKVSRSEESEMTRQQEIAYEREVQKAMLEYDQQVDKILEAEGITLNKAQREAFRTRIAQYAFDNDLTNLETAYKALKYEESKKKKAAAVKTKERAKQKKAASVVGRSGAGASGATPVAGDSSLEDIIRQSMKELSFD